MQSIKKLFKWLDDHIIELLAGFLLVFIPLYPKWPLADVLPGYIVRLRLEDLMIGMILIVWLIQVLRKKVNLKSNPLLFPILLYLIIGFISSLSAVFVTHTVPLERLHVAKLFLHWIRRIEYMSLAFIFFSAIKTPKQLRKVITTLSVVVVILTTFGFGQKYLQWPVYSTMNREFAKGWRLVLTEHARVPATFAGHYDFAAYTVIVSAIILSLALSLKRSNKSLIYYILVSVAALSSLLLTASRTSFIAYLVALTVIIFLLAVKRNIKWALTRWTAVMVVSLLAMLLFGDLSQRFAHILRINEIKEYIALNIYDFRSKQAKEAFTVSEDLALLYTETDQGNLGLVYPETDQPPVRLEDLPPDVFEVIPETLPEATLSALTDKEKEEIATLAGKPRTYSQAAFTFGLSSAIRFDALWPRAIKGFLANPILGSGYSTLVKTQTTDFTEAESTDNDFLRALGETGLLGFLSFFGIIFYALFSIWKKRMLIKDTYQYAVVVGIGGAIVGMLVNGLYIDVFEASKVAYTFWAMMGILFATLNLSSKYGYNE
jgi:O-antigen ligase